MAGGFAAETDVGAGDNESLVGERGVGVGQAGDELAVDEFEEGGGHFASIYGLLWTMVVMCDKRVLMW